MVSRPSFTKSSFFKSRANQGNTSKTSLTTTPPSTLYKQDTATLSKRKLSSPSKESITPTEHLPLPCSDNSSTQLAAPDRWGWLHRVNSFTAAARTPDRRKLFLLEGELPKMSGALFDKEQRRNSFSGPIKLFQTTKNTKGRNHTSHLKLSDAECAEIEANLDKLVFDKPKSNKSSPAQSVNELSAKELALILGENIDVEEQRRLFQTRHTKPSTTITPSKPSPRVSEFQPLSKPIDINGFTLHVPRNINCYSETMFAENPLAYRDGGVPKHYKPIAPAEMTKNGDYLRYLRRTLRHPDDKNCLIEIKGQIKHNRISEGKIKKGFSSLVDDSTLEWRVVRST